jgi:cellulose synthase/poly-beta-1,6-N-acetylglucosamine synthase-like glycosyltransferase
VIVPTSAVDSPRSAHERAETLSSLLGVDYPHFDILVCVDRTLGSQTIKRGIEDRFGTARVGTIVAEQENSPNAKIDAMQTGLRHAKTDVILFCDDDVSVDPRHFERLIGQLTGATRLVSAAAIGALPKNLWGHLECSFMNGQFARLHLAGDCLGFSGALGKTMLVRRGQIEEANILLSAGADCCEDAALTRSIKRMRGRVVLSDTPVRQPIGDQKLSDVLRRHRRWLSCRRKYLPLVFAAEGLFSAPIAAGAGGFAAGQILGQPGWGVAGTLALWCLADCLFAASHRYLAPATPLAWLIRELVFIPLWLSALFARTVNWYGRRVPVSD